MKTSIFTLLCLLFFSNFACTQTYDASQETFTRQDTLRGTLSELRSCYDVKFYDLNLRVKPDEKSITAYNVIHYEVVEDFDKIQIDLFENLEIDDISIQKGNDLTKLNFKRDGNAVFIDFPSTQKKGTNTQLKITYHGKPRVAVRPPWDGGFSWAKDKKGRDWIGVSCEGLGASVWWPNKDHLSDEPDSMRIYCEVPKDLTCVVNGNLRSKQKLEGDFVGFEWFVSYPINNYNVSLNIAHYEHFQEKYTAKDGEKLDLDYYVLDYNLEAAKEHFKQVKPMLECYETLFGKYPFWNDGYALVETSYWGMEHQSAVAYGNNYINNEFGFDFIIIHESGHEYFGNSISVNDHAEMWIHESFCTYAEALYVECTQDKKTAIKYLLGQKEKIGNKMPILGVLNVNYQSWEDADMYYKGSWMLHTLRAVVDNDELWYKTMYDFNQEFLIKNTNSEEVINFFNKKTGKDLTTVFHQYLKHLRPPNLLYKFEGKKLLYKWDADVEGFEMPILAKTSKKGKYFRLNATSKWQSMKLKSKKNKELFVNKGLFYAECERSKE
jgi:aminopeptidase N